MRWHRRPKKCKPNKRSFCFSCESIITTNHFYPIIVVIFAYQIHILNVTIIMGQK